MTTILELTNQCCYRTGDTPLRSLFLNEDNAREWLGYIGQALKSIAGEHRWQALKKDFTFTTAGNKAEYELPEDYAEMATYDIYNITHNRFIPLASDDESLRDLATHNNNQSVIRFRLMGDKIKFTYPIEDDMELMFTYVSKYVVKNKDASDRTVYKEFVSQDDDVILLDNELLILKAIAIRGVNLGLEEAQRREADYQEALAKATTSDGGNMRFNLFSRPFVNKTTPTDFQVVR